MAEKLIVKNLVKEYDGEQVLKSLSFEVKEGEFLSVLGPSGCGKTTLLRILIGLESQIAGEILLDGKDISRLPASQRGMGIIFQNYALFPNMTVLENVLIAMNKDVDYGVITALLRLPKYYKSEIAMKKKAMELLTIFHLEDKCEELACNLPYGEQRRLEIARAMAAKPKLLFLDEPAAGMNPQETAELTELIRFIRDEFHISILLIEHDMSLVMNLCERIYVLDYGKIIASGVPEEIKSNKRVIEAYLGEEV